MVEGGLAFIATLISGVDVFVLKGSGKKATDKIDKGVDYIPRQ